MRARVLMAVLMAVWLCSGAALADSTSAPAPAPTSGPSPEAKLLSETYGQRIAQALAGGDAEKVAALGREMLTAASDSGNSVELRCLLALETVKLCSSSPSDDAVHLATEALALADMLKPLPPLEKGRLELQIANQRLEAARKAGKKDLNALVTEVARAEIALAKLASTEDKHEMANGLLNSAANKVRTLRDEDLEADLAEVTKEMKALAARGARLKAAELQLQHAKDSGDNEGVKSARQAIGLIHLLLDGDVAKANEQLVATGCEYEKAVAAAAAFLVDETRIPGADAFGAILESLIKAAGAAERPQARLKVAAAGLSLCRAFLAKNPEGDAAAKARLLLVQLERLAGDSAADRFLKKLQANYKGLAGKLENLPSGLSVSYDFSSRKQLGDWETREGNWGILPGKEVLGAEVQRWRQGTFVNRLRFIADRPLTFSFAATGANNLAGSLYFVRNESRAWPYEVRAVLGGEGGRRSYLSDRGEWVWRDERTQINPNTVYRFELEWDGKKTLTWSVGGKALCKQELRLEADALKAMSVYVGVGTQDKPAAFDDVKIQGTVIEDPSQLGKPSGER